MRRAAATLAVFMLGTAPVVAECRLALALGLDVSSSVDETEDALQRQGLAKALLAPEVQAAMFSSPEPVALTVFEWSGRYQHAILLPWTEIGTPEDVKAVASRISRSRRSFVEFPTAIGYALGYAAGMFRAAPPCLFQTLDISGDGVNNEGFSPALAYAHFPLDRVTVNGLAIGGEDDLVAYYRREVVKGPGGFVEEAADFRDFHRAMRRKLVRELEAVFSAADALRLSGGG